MPCHHAALDLALDVAGVDGAADVLGGDEAQHCDLPGFRIHLDVAELGGRNRAPGRRRSPTPRR